MNARRVGPQIGRMVPPLASSPTAEAAKRTPVGVPGVASQFVPSRLRADAPAPRELPNTRPGLGRRILALPIRIATFPVRRPLLAIALVGLPVSAMTVFQVTPIGRFASFLVTSTEPGIWAGLAFAAWSLVLPVFAVPAKGLASLFRPRPIV